MGPTARFWLPIEPLPADDPSVAKLREINSLEQIQPNSQTSNSSAVRQSPGVRTRISWLTWIVDGTLLIAAIVGAWYAWPIQSEAGKLHAKRMDLQRRVGEMPIKDPSKYHVLLLKSENPLEFRWRVYFPAKNAALLSSESRSSRGSSMGTSGLTYASDTAQECIISATILQTEDKSNMEIKVRARSAQLHGSSSMNLDDVAIHKMVVAKDTSSWRIAGREQVEAFSTDELVWLLAVESPQKAEAPLQTGLIRIGFGVQEALNKVRNQ